MFLVASDPQSLGNCLARILSFVVSTFDALIRAEDTLGRYGIALSSYGNTGCTVPLCAIFYVTLCCIICSGFGY